MLSTGRAGQAVRALLQASLPFLSRAPPEEGSWEDLPGLGPGGTWPTVQLALGPSGGTCSCTRAGVRLPLPPLDLGSQTDWAEPTLWRQNETMRWGRRTGPGLRQLVLTNHWGLDETPRVGLWNVRLEDAGSAAGLIHATEHVDLAAAHGGCCGVHCLGQRRHGLPLVGDGVIPAGRGEKAQGRSGPCAGQGPQPSQQTLGSTTTCFLPWAPLAQPEVTQLGALG